MNKALLTLLLALLLLPAPSAHDISAEQGAAGAAASPLPPAQVAAPATTPESEDDIFSSTYERELLSRRYFQKTLPPLKPREKIVWSFKTARANVLL
jgi:hypothetical protein